MKKNKKFKTFLYLVLLFFFVLAFQTIAYSAINSTMTVSGDAYARAEADVRITSFRLANLTNSTSHYEEFGKNHIITEVDLNDSSSHITYYVEITNYGTIDIGIYDITGLPNGVNYSITDYNLHDKICDENNKCNGFIKKTLELTLTTTSSYSGQVQLNFDFRTYHKVTYNGITNNNYPTEVIDGGNLNITFKENLKRVQAISNGNELAYYSSISNGQTITINNILNDIELKIKPQVAKLMNGSLTEVGSEVCIKDECFYIISNDGTKVSMLAKYNLYVGGMYDKESKTWTKYGEEATGIQNPNMRGFFDLDSNRQGTTEFSNDENKGNNNNDYVGSLVEKFIKEYNQYLSNLTEDVITTRLITKEELVQIGCDLTEGQCNNNHNWILYTSYWTMSPGREDRIYYIHKNNYFNDDKYTSQNSYGVRPVIEIGADDIYVPKPTRLISGDLDTIGSEVCIKDECFLTISSTEDTVTMIAEMNISFDISSKQQDEAGTTIYDESIIVQYLNNYKTTLTNYGASINNIRLITYDELNDSSTFACEMFSGCNDEYQWIYTGEAYWTGTYSELGGVWYMSIYSNGIYDTTESGESYIEVEYGVRPVITISKENIDTNIAQEQKDFIVFSLEGRGFLAEDGMTWKEWGESKYNTFTKWDTPLTFESTYISCPTGDYYYVCNSNSVSDKVKPTDIIIAGHTYHMKSKSPE